MELMSNYLFLTGNKRTFDSSFLRRRWMFLRCVIMSRAATMIEKTVRIGLVLPNTMFRKIGKVMPAIIEDKETILVEIRISKNTLKDKAQASGKMHKTTPKIVATPFPPLKPAKTGNICPISAATPKPS